MPDDPREAGCQPAHRGNTELDEQLVAYLDGELDAESARRIESRLATDPAVRRRLQSLERTWDLLDELDAAPVGEPFTHTTLEMVAVAAREDVNRERAESPRRRRHRRLALVASLLAAVLVGFLGVGVFAPDPNRQLLDDLPVLEALDDYCRVDSIDFLRQLRREGLFSTDQSAPSRAVLPQKAHALTPQQRVENMSPAEKDQLRRTQERFLALDSAEQRHLRRLAAEMQKDPDAAELRGIMHRYCDWLKDLPQYTRWELIDLAPPARIARIKQRLLDEQVRQNVAQLDNKDAEALRQWMNDCVARRQATYLGKLPESQRKKFAQLGPVEQHRRAFALMWQSVQRRQRTDASRLPPWMTEDDLTRLRAKLSPDLQKRLDDLPTTQDQWQQVVAWIHHAMRAHNPRGAATKPRDERLLHFFEKELTDEERDRLLSLPGEEMQRQLQWLYEARTRSSGPNRDGNREPHGGDLRMPAAAAKSSKT